MNWRRLQPRRDGALAMTSSPLRRTSRGEDSRFGRGEDGPSTGRLPSMKRMGGLGGIGPRATMDFEARVHGLCQQLVPRNFNTGYPPMVVWYHRRPPVRFGEDGRPVVPMEVDPQLV